MTFLAILALSTGAALAAPAATVTPVPGKSANDQIYKNLAAAGHLQWTEVNGGRTTTILKEHWNAAATGQVSTRSTTEADPGILRRGGVSGGDVEGYTTSLSCYGRGATAQDSQIQDFALKACDTLVGANVPKPLKNALQVWQSSDFADVNGIDGYLRYSFEILEDVSEMPDVQLCTGAMDMFSSLCQKGTWFDSS